MDEAGRWSWERVLLLLAVLLGVVAMHATVALVPHDESMPAVASVMPTPAPAVGAAATELPAVDAHPGAADRPGAGTRGPMPASHQMLHLCLAVLAAGIMLGLTAAAFAIGTRRVAPCAPQSSRLVAGWARSPPRTAVRLAQLCVLRN